MVHRLCSLYAGLNDYQYCGCRLLAIDLKMIFVILQASTSMDSGLASPKPKPKPCSWGSGGITSEWAFSGFSEVSIGLG